jgi:hypothetical protein
MHPPNSPPAQRQVQMGAPHPPGRFNKTCSGGHSGASAGSWPRPDSETRMLRACRTATETQWFRPVSASGAVRVLPVWLAAGLVLPGCRQQPGEQLSAQPSTAPPPAALAEPSTRRPTQAPLADERIDIVAGTFLAGSIPGQAGRLPELEPRRYEVQLGPFQIDRLAYPNDPGRPPLTGVTRDEARRLCRQRGARLCTELEWERACKGPASDRFAGVRGAAASAAGHEPRCAARRGIDPATQADNLGFRCCKGAPNAAVIKEPRLLQTFEKVRLKADRLAKLLASDPRTKALAQDVKFFREPDAANTVVARGPGDKQGFSFTVSPLLWHPVAGAEFLLLTARSGKDKSFVLCYYVLGKDDYRLASSFIMDHEPGPVAFAYSGYIRPRLHFSTCWGCPGETGKVLHRKPDSVVILQP